ncbi:MAG: hypothetical protein MUE40_12450 [Anaerolineae bacterium]|nr:hypothetical protein [Anaerolineae bacterium]
MFVDLQRLYHLVDVLSLEELQQAAEYIQQRRAVLIEHESPRRSPLTDRIIDLREGLTDEETQYLHDAQP